MSDEQITPRSIDRKAFGLDDPLPAYTDCPACGQHTQIIGFVPTALDIGRLEQAIRRSDYSYHSGGWRLTGPSGWANLARVIAGHYAEAGKE